MKNAHSKLPIQHSEFFKIPIHIIFEIALTESVFNNRFINIFDDHFLGEPQNPTLEG